MRTAGFLLLLLIPAVLPAQSGALPAVTLRPGLVITHSVRVVPRRYRLPAPGSLDSAVIVIRGSDLTVDFGGAELRGADPGAAPDGGAGVAIRIEGGRNVRVMNARIRGYRVGLLARGTRNLMLEGIDASHNWKPRLLSLVEHESLVDWLSYHHNEADEWLRYGAALYLSGVTGGSVRATVAEQGMNALLLVGCDSLRIEGNSFRFNSGLGIGLYRSSDNRIVNNRLDYNVRGYSHRFYRRGQDSAALLLYEQSHRNLVAWNTATHSGDGLFLWAGQSTMDTGEGGASDNTFFANDFSWAPTNAMEATFSRNLFLANRAVGSDYGLWGGYSYGSRVIANCFGRNRWGIAIEHGQDNQILANRFDGDSIGIRLWGDSLEPSDWGYPKHRETASKGYRIEGNRFAGVRRTLDTARTAGITLAGNDTAALAGPPCRPGSVPPEFSGLVPKLAGAEARLPETPGPERDRSAIVVDEWGPFDWRAPRLWPVDSTRALPLRLAVLGPVGRWRVVGQRGIGRLSRQSGRVGDTVTVTPKDASDWELSLEYVGGATVSPDGDRRPAGSPYRFSFARFEPVQTWAIRFFGWKDTTDLAGFARGTPLLEHQASRLDFEWYRPLIPGLPREHWALDATTAVELPPGSKYQLRTISDDGIRVYLDGRRVIDRWDVHESVVDSVSVAPGRHDLRVEYFQSDGWTELRLEFLRR